MTGSVPAAHAAAGPAPAAAPSPAQLSAVEVFRARQRARRATVVVFYRGERSRFCRTWLRRWLSVPALERRLALADTALIFVSSQSQGKAYSVAAQSGVPDHLLDRSIIFLGDPQHTLAAYLESVNLLAPVITNPTGHRAHAWVYDFGMVQPAVVAVAPHSTVLFAWAMQPSFRNAGGKLERPDPWDAWDYIERKLDRYRIAPADARPLADASHSFGSPRQTPVSARNPTMAATLPRAHSSRTSSSVAAAAADAADAAEAAARAPAADPESAAALLAAGVSSGPLSLPPVSAQAEGAGPAPAVQEVSAEDDPSDESSEHFPTTIPHVRSGLSDLAAAAMESADASLSSIEAHKARVQFALADHVIEPPARVLRDSLRSDGTEPKTPDISLLQAGADVVTREFVPSDDAQFDDAASSISARSRSVTPVNDAVLPEDGSASDEPDEAPALAPAEDPALPVVEHPVVASQTPDRFVPAVTSQPKLAVQSDGPGSGRELIVDEFEELDEYADETVPSPSSVPVVPGPTGGVEFAAPAVISAPVEKRMQNAGDDTDSKNNVRNLIEKWAGLDAEQFGAVDPDADRTEKDDVVNVEGDVAENEGAFESRKAKYVQQAEAVAKLNEREGVGNTEIVPMPPNSGQRLEAVETAAVEIVPGSNDGSAEVQEVSPAVLNEKKTEGTTVELEEVVSEEEKPAGVPAEDVSVATMETAVATETKKSPAAFPATESILKEVQLAAALLESSPEKVRSAEKPCESQKPAPAKQTVSENKDSPVKETLVKDTSVAKQLEENETAIERLKLLEKKAKKVEFLDAPEKDDEKGDTGKAESPEKSSGASVARKMSSGVFPSERQGGWFVQNIFSRLSRQSAADNSAPSFLARRSMEQSPNYLRVPVSDDLAEDQGVLAIKRAREQSEKPSTATGTPEAVAPLEEISLNDERPTAQLGVKGRAKNILSGVKARSLPRNMSADGTDEEGKLSRKLSLFAGGTKREPAPSPRTRRNPFGRGPARTGNPQENVPAPVTPDGAPPVPAPASDRATPGLGRGSRRLRDPVVDASGSGDGDADEANVKRKMSLAKIGDAVMSKLSVSYHEAHHGPAAAADAAAENRRSSLRFARATDSPDVRRVNSNVGGPVPAPQEESAAQGSGFGRRLWSRWAKMKS